MSDIVLRQDDQLPIATRVRYKDMKDGTYALVSAVLVSGKNSSDDNIVTLCVDELTEGLNVTTYYESDVHESRRFKATYLQLHGAELANDATHDFLIKVGTKAAYHVTLRASVGGNSDLLFYESPSVSANGVALASISRNRETLGVAETIVYDTPTVTGVGTIILPWFVPGGSRGSPVGGGWGGTQWLLGPNADYLIRLTNRSGLKIQFSFSLGWSEQ